MDAGVLHAYLDGLGVELMAASDNVLRGGLTPKHIDVPELLRIIDTTPAEPPRLLPQKSRGLEVFDAGIRDFSLVRVVVSGTVTVALTGPAILLVAKGAVEVTADATSENLVAGGAVFTTAATIDISGDGEVFIAQPGRLSPDA